MDSPRGPGIRRLLLSAAVLAAIFIISLWSLEPPQPKPATAPATEFSAERAIDTLQRVLAGDVPHPAGSPADDAIRGRILTELRNLGYQPEVQTGFACSDFSTCANVNNIVARLNGSGDESDAGTAVLLAAHYDSVPAGPGDSDDGTGFAAVLEIARVLKSLPAPRHSVIFLIDEGEEDGLIGARVFVGSHPWAKQVRAAVNIDDRGTSGPSVMFETGSANEWAVNLYAQHVVRPAANSLAYTVYKRLPNDTDFTIFKAAGYQGLNFAYIGDEPHYHTELDNSANVDAASVQHHGDNALPSVLSLANADLSNPKAGDAVYFDIFERRLVRWPARRTVIVAACILVLLIAELAWVIWRKRLSWGQLALGLMAWPLAMIVTGVLAEILIHILRFAGGLPVNWVAHPLPAELLCWALALTCVFTHGAIFARRAGFWGLWSGVWLWWTVLALIASLVAPGASYGLLVPSALAVIACLPQLFDRVNYEFGSVVTIIVPLAGAGVVSFSMGHLLFVALGNSGIPVVTVAAALLLSPFIPLCVDLVGLSGIRRLALPWIPIFATALAAFATVVVPAYSAKSPERVNIEYWQDADSGMAEWVIQPNSGHLSEPMRLAANFRRAVRGAFPWEPGTAFVSDAPHLDLAAPTFTILESSQAAGRRSFRALLRSERGAPYAAVMFPPGSGVDSVSIGDQSITPQNDALKRYFGGWNVYSVAAIAADGVEIRFSVPLGKPVDVSAADETYGLPPEGAFLLNARPLTETPSQSGDVTVVTRRVQLFP